MTFGGETRNEPRNLGRRVEPHVVLCLSTGLVLVFEALRGSATVNTSAAWPALQALVALIALAHAWRFQQRLQLAPLIVIALAFELAWVCIHLALGVRSDADSIYAYPRAGDALLSGRYPSSEYPPGAVLLFAFDSLVSGGGHEVRVSHAFVMIPFQLATVLGVWALRTRWSRWLAAVVALWPLDAFFWEFKFDAAPTAMLAAGLSLATRRRWAWAGVALGVGAALKWTPALSGLVLAVWLLGRGRARAASAHLLGLVGTFALVNLPFLVRWPHEVLFSYRDQAGRGITAESFYYLPLRALGIVRPGVVISHAVGAPGWADHLAIGVQSALLVALLATASRTDRLRGGVSLAALAPVVFLLTNRIFSPQFLVTCVAAWAIAASLLAESRSEQLRFALVVFGATLANVLVYPTGAPYWPAFSAGLFFLSFVATGWFWLRTVAARPTTHERGRRPSVVSAMHKISGSVLRQGSRKRPNRTEGGGSRT
jgi:hypothetical protein